MTPYRCSTCNSGGLQITAEYVGTRREWVVTCLNGHRLTPDVASVYVMWKAGMNP